MSRKPNSKRAQPSGKTTHIVRLRAYLSSMTGFVAELAHEFIDKGCQKSAAALTYMTLFALVPLMTVTYAMFSIIPAFDGVAEELQGMIFTHFLPETGNEVTDYLADFSSQARSLTKVGVVILLVTAYLMLRNIEKTFNAIWGVRQGRSGLFGYLLYWAILSIGPLLLGAGFVVSTYLLSLKLIVTELNEWGLTSTIVQLLPWLMTSVAFTLLFVAVPNCRVPFRFGLIGGILTAILFELLKNLFGYLVANSSFKLIYGAFAVVPLFLLWINFLWTIILGGAVFVRTLAEHSYASRVLRYSDMLAVLRCLALFRDKLRSGATVGDKDCVNLGLGLVHWQRLRSLLVEFRWIVVTDSGDYVLSRDLKQASLWDVAEMVRLPVNEQLADNDNIPSPEPWLRDFLARQAQIGENARQTYAIPLETLFSQER
ncbi:YihY family inner membrane protein [Teredinibacter purpureus]|uniref:YihY family inner membrane protein n=1 Tax=Teredinibacter purpureus TaxID=2731756 RepID=UPI0006967CCC